MTKSKAEELDAKLKELNEMIEVETNGKRLQELFCNRDRVEAEIDALVFRDF